MSESQKHNPDRHTPEKRAKKIDRIVTKLLERQSKAGKDSLRIIVDEGREKVDYADGSSMTAVKDMAIGKPFDQKVSIIHRAEIGDDYIGTDTREYTHDIVHEDGTIGTSFTKEVRDWDSGELNPTVHIKEYKKIDDEKAKDIALDLWRARNDVVQREQTQRVIRQQLDEIDSK